MRIIDDIAYYRLRIGQEDERARRAQQRESRQLHRQLAALYADRVREAERELALLARITSPA